MMRWCRRQDRSRLKNQNRWFFFFAAFVFAFFFGNLHTLALLCSVFFFRFFYFMSHCWFQWKPKGGEWPHFTRRIISPPLSAAWNQNIVVHGEIPHDVGWTSKLVCFKCSSRRFFYLCAFSVLWKRIRRHKLIRSVAPIVNSLRPRPCYCLKTSDDAFCSKQHQKEKKIVQKRREKLVLRFGFLNRLIDKMDHIFCLLFFCALFVFVAVYAIWQWEMTMRDRCFFLPMLKLALLSMRMDRRVRLNL